MRRPGFNITQMRRGKLYRLRQHFLRHICIDSSDLDAFSDCFIVQLHKCLPVMVWHYCNHGASVL